MSLVREAEDLIKEIQLERDHYERMIKRLDQMLKVLKDYVEREKVEA